MNSRLTEHEETMATIILGVDTLWGGDVMNPSGKGRFIADTYFSGKPLPAWYPAERFSSLRLQGGAAGKATSKDVYDATRHLQLREALRAMRMDTRRVVLHPSQIMQSRYINGLTRSLDIMLNMAFEAVGLHDGVKYRHSVVAATGTHPKIFDVTAERQKVHDLLELMGEGPSQHGGNLYDAVSAWRAKRLVSRNEMGPLSQEIITRLNAGTEQYVLPHLPEQPLNFWSKKTRIHNNNKTA